jgi:hypothetical protein
MNDRKTLRKLIIFDALSFSEVERRLIRLYEASRPDDASKLRARIRNLQKLSVQPGNNPGRGNRISYRFRDYMRWIFCFELAELGIEPAKAVTIVAAILEDVEEPFREAVHAGFDGHFEPERDVLICFWPSLMTMAWESFAGTKTAEYSFMLWPARELPKMMSWSKGSMRRLSCINLSNLGRRVAAVETELSDKA